MAFAFAGLSLSFGSVDSALAGTPLAAEELVSTTSTSKPLAEEWLARQASPTTIGPPSELVPSTTVPPPTTTSTTAPDPMAGLARYDVQVGSFAGPAWRLSDVEPGRLGRGEVALLVCSCNPAELQVGDPVGIDGRAWQVSRTGVAPSDGLAELLAGAPVVPVVRIVSSFEDAASGGKHPWVEVR